jgi:hypothetical protein
MPPARIAYVQSRSWVDAPCCSATLRFYPAGLSIPGLVKPVRRIAQPGSELNERVPARSLASDAQPRIGRSIVGAESRARDDGGRCNG